MQKLLCKTKLYIDTASLVKQLKKYLKRKKKQAFKHPFPDLKMLVFKIAFWSALKAATFLFSEIDCSAFAYYINLNLTGILKLAFNFLHDISCEKHPFIIRNCFRHNHDTNHAACLNSECIINTGE